MNEHYAAVLTDLEQMKEDAEDGIRAIKRLISRAASPPPVRTNLFGQPVPSGSTIWEMCLPVSQLDC